MLIPVLILAANIAPDLTAALNTARGLWGIDVSVSIDFRALGPCRRLDQSANMEWIEVDTSFRPESEDSIAAPETAPETVTTHSRVLAIHINSACDWNRLPLQETVTHEYGHALGLWNYHSQDKRSVMYPMPMRGQVIMREDRAALVAVAGQGR